MTGIGRSNELRAYSASEWKADVGYLVREFEIQEEIERSKRTDQTKQYGKTSAGTKNHFLGWIFGKRNAPR